MFVTVHFSLTSSLALGAARPSVGLLVAAATANLIGTSLFLNAVAGRFDASTCVKLLEAGHCLAADVLIHRQHATAASSNNACIDLCLCW